MTAKDGIKNVTAGKEDCIYVKFSDGTEVNLHHTGSILNISTYTQEGKAEKIKLWLASPNVTEIEIMKREKASVEIEILEEKLKEEIKRNP